MPEREEKRERKEHERMRERDGLGRKLDNGRVVNSIWTALSLAAPTDLTVSSLHFFTTEKAFLPEARTREKEFPGDISTILVGNDGRSERAHRTCFPLGFVLIKANEGAK